MNDFKKLKKQTFFYLQPNKTHTQFGLIVKNIL